MLDTIAVVLAILVTVAAAETVRLTLRRSLSRPLRAADVSTDESPAAVLVDAVAPVVDVAPEHAAA